MLVLCPRETRSRRQPWYGTSCACALRSNRGFDGVKTVQKSGVMEESSFSKIEKIPTRRHYVGIAATDHTQARKRSTYAAIMDDQLHGNKNGKQATASRYGIKSMYSKKLERNSPPENENVLVKMTFFPSNCKLLRRTIRDHGLFNHRLRSMLLPFADANPR